MYKKDKRRDEDNMFAIPYKTDGKWIDRHTDISILYVCMHIPFQTCKHSFDYQKKKTKLIAL